jgi:hypothetical protein
MGLMWTIDDALGTYWIAATSETIVANKFICVLITECLVLSKRCGRN